MKIPAVMTCQKCLKEKPRSRFYDPRKLGKHSTVCWECRKQMAFEKWGPKKSKEQRDIEAAEKALARAKAERDEHYAR